MDPLTDQAPARWRRARALMLAAFLGGAAAAAGAQVYAGTDAASGALVLSNFGSEQASELLIPDPAAPPAAAGAASAPAATRARATAPDAVATVIREAAKRYALPEALLTAVVAVESGFDPNAVSPKGARGLMQLMPDTARRFAVRDVFAVRDNVHGGAAYLKELVDRFENDLSLALAAYNAGEGAVLRAGRRVPSYPETRQYVAKVLALAGPAAPTR